MKRLAGDDELGSGDFSTLLESLMAQSPDNYPPFDRVPCSNADCSIRWGCPNGGKLVCGRCQLVRYCSKVSDYPLLPLLLLGSETIS